MICKKLKDCFLVDQKRLNPNMTVVQAIKLCMRHPGISAVITLRIAQYFFSKRILWRFSPFLSRLNQIINGFECHINAKIGEGLFLPHSQNIVIGEGAKIGNDVVIYNGVTLGAKKMAIFNEDQNIIKERYPIIEDNVIIYTGAKLFGSIRVGKGAVIGANAVVMVDVPPGKVAVGIPAIIK